MNGTHPERADGRMKNSELSSKESPWGRQFPPDEALVILCSSHIDVRLLCGRSRSLARQAIGDSELGSEESSWGRQFPRRSSAATARSDWRFTGRLRT